ncbi:hypothetical protein [Nonomuraea sp. SYSU D8015]|uniref:hypothetical protein n=1 Tax=Nonomuraea sp. SYSU D8015 TaxID=2593644 RepID=UPI00166024C7|nr:hypothetical protein [Nonomuraea sp. SYSU D8015]
MLGGGAEVVGELVVGEVAEGVPAVSGTRLVEVPGLLRARAIQARALARSCWCCS